MAERAGGAARRGREAGRPAGAEVTSLCRLRGQRSSPPPSRVVLLWGGGAVRGDPLPGAGRGRQPLPGKRDPAPRGAPWAAARENGK